eukprot:TRINITY_DN3966_c0_g1_i1.p1 TRINITY_DN3966_c0_g1~~TRINITY_DN3966_c0_g1_i1.p1  ORF type:complete len:158 (+),score=26.65 TRINITY_DN3966_c0_g1_i1:244-717(+)
MGDLNEKLDSTICDYAKCYEELQVLYSNLTSHMKKGHWNISQARYAMGGFNSITPLQYDNNMKPTRFYEKDTTEIKSTESSLRNRKGGDDDQDQSPLPKQADPIQWFGYLTPPSLRQSQTDFISATTIVYDIAETRKKMTALSDQYRSLLQEKAGSK